MEGSLVGCDDGWMEGSWWDATTDGMTSWYSFFYDSIHLFGKSILAEGSIIFLLASRSPIASRLSVGRGGSQ